MLDFLLLIMVFWCGFTVGEHVMAWKLRDIVRDAARREGFIVSDDYVMEDPDKPHVAKLYIEKEKDTLYLYDHDKQRFVCQAKSMEELAKLALEHKNIKYAAVLDGDHTFMFIDGIVKQHI
jgi:hypothetical protein